MEEDLFRREAHRQGGIELPAGDHVQPHALLLHDPAEGLAVQGFAGIGHQPFAAVVAVDRLPVAGARPADLPLIQQVEGGAELLGQFHRVAAANRQVAMGIHV